MKNNKNAFSIVLAMILTLIMSLMALYLIDYIIPFSKNVKWIENVSKAYYQAESWIEESLYYLKNNFWTDNTKTFIATKAIDYESKLVALWTVLPVAWQWNSEFDSDFNRLRIWEPIQLKVWNNRLVSGDWDDIEFTFRIPDLDNNNNDNEKFDVAINDNFIINWQLISSDWLLNSSWSLITYKDINDGFAKKMFQSSPLFSNSLNNDYISWSDLNNNSDNFQTFYSNKCWAWKECILKMSVINKLEALFSSKIVPIPYLEWKIYLDNWKKIPLRYSQIHSDWKSYWFKKSLDVKIPQQTVNEAFDFTVFQ
jgi:hypothetical protein